MANDKSKAPNPKGPAAGGPKASTPAAKNPQAGVAAKPAVTTYPASPAAEVSKLPPLFRRIDWLTFFITFVIVWAGYYLTMAPELTLEDSGELATGSYYAGIPHPPGYPVWTI